MKQMQLFWFICSRSTGLYLPALSTAHRGRAATHQKLTDSGPPRLFRTKAHAKQALDWWLSGEWYTKHYTGMSSDGWLDDIGDVECRKVPERATADMEVQPVALVVGPKEK